MRDAKTKTRAALGSCLHCGSMYHLWVNCPNTCIHCNSTQVRKRCPNLNTTHYTPGGFKIGEQRRDLVEKHPDGGPLLEGGVLNATPTNNAMPSVFQQGNIFGQDSMVDVLTPEGINEARAAMIAATPVYESAQHPGFKARLGPAQSGSNQIPLGIKDWPASAGGIPDSLCV